MSRFGGRNRGGGGRNSARSRSNRGRGRSQSGGNFTSIGSLSLVKDQKNLVRDLRSDDLRLIWTVYTPKGSDSVTLRKGDKVFVQIGEKGLHPEAPEFLVGKVSLFPEEGSGGSSGERPRSRSRSRNYEEEDYAD